MSRTNTDRVAAHHRSRGLSRLGAVAAVAAAVVLLAGLAGLVVSSPDLGLRNWLVVLFQINSGIGRFPAEPLRVLNPVDVAALVLVGLAFLGLWPGPNAAHRVWMGVAVALPLAGIAVLLVTGQAGRSSVMASGLVVAILMLMGRGTRRLGVAGILANALLLAGDFATGDSPVPVVAVLVATGYLLLVAWFLLIAARLLGGSPRRSIAAGAAP